MEARKVTLLVLLDLSAAFDTVRHETILSRLRSRFGVDGKALDWFASYLADCSQRVAENRGVCHITCRLLQQSFIWSARHTHQQSAPR